MLPMTFNRKVLETLFTQDGQAIQRVIHVLHAVIMKRVLPYFKRRGADAIVLARISQHLAIQRLEDEEDSIHVVSLLLGERDGWVISIHERIFDYLAFVVPRDPGARLGGGTAEEGKMLALGVDPERGVGSIIPVQATALRLGGEGEPHQRTYLSVVHATGNIQTVMDESRKVATTGILHCADALGIDVSRTGMSVHLHFMGGSTKKDGPSAGGAIALALASAFSGRPLRRDVAMTGEIDIQGRITGVGGLHLKLETSFDAGCKTLLIPKENLYGPEGMERLPQTRKNEMQILWCAV